jgi:hypothetical protein
MKSSLRAFIVPTLACDIMEQAMVGGANKTAIENESYPVLPSVSVQHWVTHLCMLGGPAQAKMVRTTIGVLSPEAA